MIASTIDEMIDALTVADRVVPATLAYGVDMSCTTDLTPTMADVNPESGIGVAEMTVRRLITPRGMIIDDLSWGIDLRSYVNRGTTAIELASIEAAVRTEVQRDDRIANTVVTVTYDTVERRLAVKVVITLFASDQTFSLLFFVTADGVQLQGSIDANG